MSMIKVAILEDNKSFLKDLVSNVRRTKLVNVISYASSSDEFLKNVSENPPDALLLDIHLAGESISGIEIAQQLKLPVLFLSADRKSYVDKIDVLKYDGNFPVEEVGKTPDEKKLSIILSSFIPRVVEHQKKHRIIIKPKGREEIAINPSDVSYIETIKGTGDHKIYFFSRAPIETSDTTFKSLRDIGFSEALFYKLGKSLLLNKDKTRYEDSMVFVKCRVDSSTNIEERYFMVPNDSKKEVRETFLSNS